MTIRPLHPDLAQKAQVELNEDPKRLSSDLQHIKDWIAKQPHLRARTDDQWLVAFLRGCKFSLERAKEKLELYYAVRTTAPELHRIHQKHPKFEEILDLGAFIYLRNSGDLNSPIVAVVRPGAYDPAKVSVSDVVSVSNVLSKILLIEDDQAVISGIRTIVDLDNVTMGHLVQMTPLQIKKMVVSAQDGDPFRMKGTHYLNTSKGFEIVFNAFNNLLNEKNKKRTFVHNKNYEEMYKHISKDILPAEYGGNAGTIKDITDYWKKKVQEHREFLDEDLNYGTDEAKRPGKPKTAEDMFGVEGSFRQLEFD